jgi:hypothetical protein
MRVEAEAEKEQMRVEAEAEKEQMILAMNTTGISISQIAIITQKTENEVQEIIANHK